MTPAINQVRKAGVDHRVHEYQHDPSSESYGTEAAEKLGLSPEQVFKTLVVSLDGKTLAVGIVPVAGKLNLKQIAKAAGAKKAAMADPAEVERVTGYVMGGVSPLGQKKRLATFIDASAQQYSTMHVSAGRRGLEIELAPDDLCRLTSARFAAIAG
ncbi:Cys-tRNA(Pro) deacylase [Marinobacterium sediminicola]|uniref:Cys-tRNA(Pro)/Cys-tRNA(Cys) deacylase n=1 Tax=Marinobacterium sediminicola TaxID=518898 RepID=A0ABY1S128_9GAMM|nr:Cys-tRNA(Pro) deacylase [Marinobacterium sediminicola]ULG69828.1 Cys-tRNA(Pro) deacylase [Marinobacterium sediminicola]SMR75358.1 Cys-tRNA(Pro)/Cys-tRNA(Cys) deacylase [Marinobacterium sediminicola]